MAVADERALYALTFADSPNQENLLEKIKQQTGREIEEGTNGLLERLTLDLQAYFSGKSVIFELPLCLIGTSFQLSVWQLMQKILYGQTVTYKQLAQSLGDEKKARAVANACRNNPLLIIIPCHRVCASNGELGGYVAGIEKKKALLKLEKSE